MCRVGFISGLLCLAAISSAQIRPPRTDIKTDYDLLIGNRKEVNWRGSTKVDYELRIVPRGRTKPTGTAVVWAFGNPKDNAHGAGQAVKPNPPTGKIVYTQNLGPISGDQKFTIDFGDFAPQSKFFLVLSQTPSGLTPEQLAMYNTAKEMEAANKKQAQETIGKQGTVEYIVQVVTSDGAASSWSSVDFGEPKPGSAKTEAEYLSIRPTQEFPEAKYSTSGSVDKNDTLLEYRWRTAANAKKAMIRVIDGTFTQGWGLWFKEGVEMTSATVNVTPNTWTNYSIGSLKLPSKSKSGYISMQVTPLKDNGDMAGMPSAPVVLKVSTTTTPPPSAGKKFQYQIELVGWRPPYLGASDDKYRFVISGPVNPKIEGDVTKIIGKSPTKGTKLYLPPKPPENKDDEPWYKKVYKAIATVVDFISKEVDLIAGNLPSFIEALLKAGPEYVAKKAGVSQASIKKAWSAAESPMKITNDSLAPLRAIQGGSHAFVGRMLDDMGVKDKNVRATMGGNLRYSVDTWARDNSYLQTTSTTTTQGLAADPDFQVHTAIAFVRVKANKVDGLANDYREPGPTIDIKVGAYSGESENLGTKPELYELFNQTFTGPTMGSDEEVILAIPLKYHWSHDSKPSTWKYGVTHSQKVLFTLNGKAFFTQPMFKEWGKTAN